VSHWCTANFFFFFNIGKNSSFHGKMALLNIISTAWAYSLITLGTKMLNSVFSFYYVKLFLQLYKISEVAFYQAQVRWNLYFFFLMVVYYCHLPKNWVFTQLNFQEKFSLPCCSSFSEGRDFFF
jgi:hypothetical protein